MPSGHHLQGCVTLFVSMGHLKRGAQISIQFILDYYFCFFFFLTTIPGFRSYHHIPAEYLVLLPIQKTVCTGSASLEFFWGFLYSRDKRISSKMPVYNQDAGFVMYRQLHFRPLKHSKGLVALHPDMFN